jgi:hypothetical protein
MGRQCDILSKVGDNLAVDILSCLDLKDILAVRQVSEAVSLGSDSHA